MYGLGIEATAHTLGIGVTDEELSNISNIQKTYVPKLGGIHPREAAQHHMDEAEFAIREALEAVQIELKDLSFIAFSQGPGFVKMFYLYA